MSKPPITREHMARVDAAIIRAKAVAASRFIPHPDDARPSIAHRLSIREVDAAVLKEKARMAEQGKGQRVPPPGLECSARLP